MKKDKKTDLLNILLIEDDSDFAKLVERLLTHSPGTGFAVTHAASLSNGIKKLDKSTFDACIVDLNLPDSTGLNTFNKIAGRYQALPIVVLTSHADDETAIEAVHRGAQDYLLKNQVDEHTLVRSLQYAIERKRIQAELRKLNEELEERVHRQTAKLSTTIRQQEREMAQRKMVEENLAAESERLAVMLRSIGDAVITTDLQGNVVVLNQTAEKLTGWSEQQANGLHLTKVFTLAEEKEKQECAEALTQVLRDGKAFNPEGDKTLMARNGEQYSISVHCAPMRNGNSNVMGAVLVFRDVTHERKREESLQKADKLESIGILAGGLAHDFNNIITAILGNLSLAKRDTSLEESTSQLIQEAESACLQARKLTAQLLTFAKGGAPVKKAVSLKKILKDTAGFASRGSRLKCSFDIASDIATVDIDVDQIEQVIRNLVINAAQAMPEGGKLQIKAQNTTIDQASDLPLAPGTYVVISVKDNGPGVPEDQLARIFEPYFTTKPDGSGLGLAAAYSIIKKHGGHMDVQSTSGKDTTFFIYLPVSKKPPAKKSEDNKFVPGEGRILIMDDEDMVRRIACVLLSRLGYDVEESRDGAEAIEKYAAAHKSGRPFDAVILDLTVRGGMSGLDTIKRLRAMDPAIKAIVSSGYCDHPVMAEYEKHGFTAAIAKPWPGDELSRIVNSVVKKTEGAK